MSRIVVTDHAVQRYIRRHAPGLSYAQASAELEHLLAGTAAAVREKSINGQEMWRVDNPPMLCVMKVDAGQHVCVTVLPKHALEEGRQEGGTEADEMLAAYERIRNLVESAPRSEAEVALERFRTEAKANISRLRSKVDNLTARREELRGELRQLGALVVTGKAPQESRASRQRSVELEAQVRSLEKKYQKQVAHADLMRDDRNTVKRCLTIAVRALHAMDSAAARAAIDEIAQIDEGLARGLLIGSAEKAS
jgi:hypothetical protein